MSAQPQWDIPKNLPQLLDDDEGGIWQDDRWTPILLTAMLAYVARRPSCSDKTLSAG